MERLNSFINELTELTKKYNFAIGACGCCDSPWIMDLKEEYENAECVNYDADKERYTYYYKGVLYR